MAAVVPLANQPTTQGDESESAACAPDIGSGASSGRARISLAANAQNPAAGLRIHPDGADTTPTNNGADYEEDALVQTKERLSTDVAASGVTAASSSTTRTRIPPRLLRSPVTGRDSQIDAHVTPRASRLRQSGHFVLHYFEMCVSMCVGFAVGDLIYFWAAGLFSYSEPFTELPEVSVMVVTFTMTAPMTAWMLFRGMPRRATAEMSAAMPALALALLALGWLAIFPRATWRYSSTG